MSRKPDYDVGAMNKRTDQKARVGAAWINDNGTITVTINEFVVLPPGGPDLVITLFPRKGSDDPA